MYIAEKKWLEAKVRFNTFLWNIYGIGVRKRKIILRNFGLNHKQRMGVIREGSIYKKAIMFIDDSYTTEISLARIREGFLSQEIRIHSLRGWRMSKGLPSKGQNSHTNGNTAARLKIDYHYTTKKARLLRHESEFSGPNKRKKLRRFFKKLKAKAARKKGKNELPGGRGAGRGFKGRNYQKRRGRKSKGRKKTRKEQRLHRERKRARVKRMRKRNKRGY